MKQIHSVILDVDGTLVDSNDAHAHAWIDAMGEQGHHIDFDRVRPLIGMGGDKVLPEVLGIDKDSPEGKKISQRRKEIFKTRYLSTVRAFPRTDELLQRLHDQGLKLVIATSAEPDELKNLLQIISPHAESFFAEETSAQDAKKSKPSPDVMQVALERAGCSADEALMLGDTVYDIEAAAKVNVQTIALRCGGWSDKDLHGALTIYSDPADLLAHYEESPLSHKA